MKTLGHFSKRKFQALDSSVQQNSLLKLTDLLDEDNAARADTSELVREIISCLNWSKDAESKPYRDFAEALNSDNDIQSLSLAIATFRSHLGINMSDTQLRLIKGDGIRNANPDYLVKSRQMIVILDNLRSAFNVGSIFRSAECLSLGSLWLCGVTAQPGNPALIKTAMGTAERVDWKYFADTQTALKTARAEGFTTYALETAVDAESVFTADFQLPLALVVGNESLGIGESILGLCDQAVILPVQGWKNSLNVGAAFAACAYQIVFGNPSPSIK